METESNMFNRLLLWARPNKLKINQCKFKDLHVVRGIKTRTQADKKNTKKTGPSSSIYDKNFEISIGSQLSK